MVRRNRREALRKVRKEDLVGSGTEEEDILEERDAFPLGICIPSARARGGPPLYPIPVPIDPGMS